MPETLERSKLHVEGGDDLHCVVHLLIRHGVSYDSDPWPSDLPKIEEKKGIEKLLSGIETGIKASTGRVVGFLIDADTSLANRWASIRDRLISVNVEDVPDTPPAEGFIGESAKFKSRVGVWLMPDNQQDGKLEDFLRSLIAEGNPLIAHAETSTEKATELGATFTAADRIKAVIHAWLAWQEVPGLPYGTAMKARYFLHDAANATRFVHWFKNLYNIR